MRGSTRKRGATWTALWDGQDPKTGRRKQKSKGGFRTQKDAQRHLASVITAVSEGTYVEPSKQPLGRFIADEWLPAIHNAVRPLTFENYRRLAERHVQRHTIGEVPLRSVTAGTLNALYGELERDGLSAGTIGRVHAVLGRALADARRWGKIPRNPAPDATPPRATTRAAIWSARELRQFLAYVKDDRLYALWRLGATTGMRRGELLGVTWRALDLDGARVEVNQQLLPTPGGCTFGPPKSKRSERTIALDADTVAVLRQHREMQQLERAIAADVYVDHDLVFCDELGGPIQPGTLTERFAKARRAAGLTTGSLHILRHTAATLALTATPPVPLHIVAGRLGDDPRTLLSTYAHHLPRSDEQAAETVAAVIADKPLTRTAV